MSSYTVDAGALDPLGVQVLDTSVHDQVKVMVWMLSPAVGVTVTRQMAVLVVCERVVLAPVAGAVQVVPDGGTEDEEA
ncbi:MAG: hypothetical protein JRN50_03015 [Nitrososphaerota archaeon]|nr:hypothetical protein [Nitrososphaerota archaeon]